MSVFIKMKGKYSLADESEIPSKEPRRKIGNAIKNKNLLIWDEKFSSNNFLRPAKYPIKATVIKGRSKSTVSITEL